MPKSILRGQYALMMLIWCAAMSAWAHVPPHPLYTNPPQHLTSPQIENLAVKGNHVKPDIPDNVLVLKVAFSDANFVATPQWPDNLVHDTAFFERWMLHLADFFLDASHGGYQLSYYVDPTTYILPHALGYYGADTTDKIDANVGFILRDLASTYGTAINYGSYDGVVIFHAGAGQESDISSLKTDDIWSTFLTRKDLQATYDPENDNYPGFTAPDGSILKNVVIVPESEFQDYFPAEGQDNAEAYLFSIYGVLAHQFGHLIGLPTLFDNDSSNGRSQGIGNWGLMGTGVWNGNGYVPAQLSAWSRYYLGWENAVTVRYDAENLVVDHFLNHSPDAIRLYKIPISEHEYYLVENRQQNPDGSLDPISNAPSYTFKLLPEGQQEYYPDSTRPYFNFMTNRYVGSEWDFFLPGLGGPLAAGGAPLVDGSGLLIWHIDENVIANSFEQNFDTNQVNANALHKGVDLEEADGMEQLDTAVYDVYKYGSPYDSFRQGNNNYFGDQTHNGLLSLPTASSYYGGIPLQIYDISQSSNTATFSVSFNWKLDTGYQGVNRIGATMIDYDHDGNTEIFYPTPDGQLRFWKNEVYAPEYERFLHGEIPYNYIWDGTDLYVPIQVSNLVRFYKSNSLHSIYVLNRSKRLWASHPVSMGSQVAVPLYKTDVVGSEILILDKASAAISQTISFEDSLVANIAYQDQTIYAITKNSVRGYELTIYNIQTAEHQKYGLNAIGSDSTVVAIFKAPILPNSVSGEIVIQTTGAVYLFDITAHLILGFPYVHNLNSIAPITISDVDRNGTLDIIIGGENSFIVVDYAGKAMTPPSFGLSNPESLGVSAGVLATDLDGDGKTEFVGNFSNNRMAVWEDKYKLKTGYPIAFEDRSRNLPVIGKASDQNYYLWGATDNGKIFRSLLPDFDASIVDTSWTTAFGNLERTGSRGLPQRPGQFYSPKTFVPGEVYIFPNPLKSIYGENLTLHVMTSQDTQIKIKIFDISGALIYQQTGFAKAYLQNREIISIPARKLSSGVYIANVSGGGDSVNLKFAVEK